MIEDPTPSGIKKNDISQTNNALQVEVEPDRTEELYNEIKDIFSGSWKYSHASPIDGEREVSWGTVPFSNQSYFIIDFQNVNRTITRGGTEGGKKGFDSYIGAVIKIEEQDGLYRLTYKDLLDTINPNRKNDIILSYNSENDTMTIMGYGDNLYENPSEMIRISEPLHR